MHHCIISLASNCNQAQNLAEARSRLSQILLDCDYTPELWSAPFGTSGAAKRPDRYLNQLVYARTILTAQQLEQQLKAIETGMGRSQDERNRGIVCIDLDLMQHDTDRHHLRDWERPYIQSLLAFKSGK